jgi:hypothetical protein
LEILEQKWFEHVLTTTTTNTTTNTKKADLILLQISEASHLLSSDNIPFSNNINHIGTKQRTTQLISESTEHTNPCA